MKVTFWGVRGSIPVPGPDTVRYGGNTACVEVTGAKNECIILDAGSGIRVLGLDLMKRGPLPPINILISHTHWDHIQGFPFFVPCYIPGTQITVRGPVHYLENRSIRDAFDVQMQYEFFPVSNEQLGADLVYETLIETSFKIGGIRITTQFVNHPIRCLAYRLEEKGKSLVYATDHEPYFNMFGEDEAGNNGHDKKDEEDEGDDEMFTGAVDTMVEEANQRFVKFVAKTDLFISDAMYTPAEYPATKRNWGHSSWDHCLQWMKDAQAKRMVLTHHDPLRTDDQVDKILQEVHAAAKKMKVDPTTITMGREGNEIIV